MTKVIKSVLQEVFQAVMNISDNSIVMEIDNSITRPVFYKVGGGIREEIYDFL